MTITFYSNYLNHHQLPLCLALQRLTEGNFRFVASDPITQVRLKLGYKDMNQMDFVVREYESAEARREAERLAAESDIVIVGGSSERYVRIRNRLGKPTFKFSERPLKRLRSWLSPKIWLGYHPNSPVYMFCAGDYGAKDFARLGMYKNRCYRWGYFPETVEYPDFENMMAQKKPGKIIWVGRFIDCKHADHAVAVVERLKSEGYDFIINMIGSGELRPALFRESHEKGLNDMLRFPGPLPVETVREQMEKSAVMLITSDRREGWGAVVNEAMNSGCAVLASDCVGSAATMIRDGENGEIYPFGDLDALYNKLKDMLDNPDQTARIGRAAYRTIVDQWNAENAAARLVKLAEAVLAGEKNPDLFPDGVCSRILTVKKDG